MQQLIDALEVELTKHGNAKIALEQKAYLRNKFDFFGIKTTERRDLMKPFFIKDYLPQKNEVEKLIIALWEKPQREYQYFAQELAFLYVKKPETGDINLFEYMVTNKSWWDTVDFIATKLMGAYFKSFPEQRKFYVSKWIVSENIWLQRSALLFQLKYKKDLDKDLLIFVIQSLRGSKEFFINKAVGWILREYSKTDPEWVADFVGKTKLNPLSEREALKLIINY